MDRMRFGILSFPIAPYTDLADRWRAVEAMGFDSAWLADDIAQRGYADFEPWALLGALARDTTRLRIGTLVTTTAYRHPALLAAQAVTVDLVSGGRLEIGIGSGGPPNDYAIVGEPVWPPKERMDRLEEQLAILGPLLGGKPVTYSGRHYRSAVSAPPMAVQQPRPPLIVAAHAERGLAIAAHYADGWNSLGGQPYKVAQDPTQRLPLTATVVETARLSQKLDELCVEHGRDPRTVRRSVLAYRPIVDPLSSLDAFDDYVGRYREIGIDEMIFYWPPLDNLFPRRPGTLADETPFEPGSAVTSAQQAAFETIAAARISRG